MFSEWRFQGARPDHVGFESCFVPRTRHVTLSSAIVKDILIGGYNKVHWTSPEKIFSKTVQNPDMV